MSDNKFFELEKIASGAFKYITKTLVPEGQIDKDSDGDPIVLGCKKVTETLVRVYIQRGGKKEHFVMNPRGKVIKTSSFEFDDTFELIDKSKDKPKPKNDGSERSKFVPKDDEDESAIRLDKFTKEISRLLDD